MKKLNVLLVSAFMLMAIQFVNAQKIASLDYEAVLSMMPDAQKVSAELDTQRKAKEAEFKKLGDAFQADVEKFYKEVGALTDAQKQAKQSELAGKQADLEKTQKNLQQMAANAEQDLLKKRETLLKPVIERLNTAIDKVAKANGIEFIIDASALIYRGGLDATDFVKKELGIK